MNRTEAVLKIKSRCPPDILHHVLYELSYIERIARKFSTGINDYDFLIDEIFYEWSI